MPNSDARSGKAALPSTREPSLRVNASRISGSFVVVGIGASAGGLEASKKFVSALRCPQEKAFILVQHLDPNHQSMMVELLAPHTEMIVRQAEDGMQIQPDHLYVIPPASNLSVGGGCLHLSPPGDKRGVRLPFDFLLQSMAESYGPRAVCVILSGTGADGSSGLTAVKASGGLVLVQEPTEAGYDGMPQSAISTGRVDLVLAVADIAAKLAGYGGGVGVPPTAREGSPPGCLSAIIDLLRVETGHDLSLYKPGTLQRRVERRMAMVAIKPNDMEQYLRILRDDAEELALLASDLLIHVTSFFRDSKVFAYLADTVVPDMVRRHELERPMRVWVPGCSTGEETYSLAILFLEEIGRVQRPIQLQIFASDVDTDAVDAARDGFYPEAITACVSPERLARFFSREDGGWRVLPDLRAIVVFTVQNILDDPPFSHLDLVSCRNLLIYVQPDAQAKIISLFHFALRTNGYLLLGTAETAGAVEGGFEIVSKTERLYRRIGRSRTYGAIPVRAAGNVMRPSSTAVSGRPPLRPLALAELGRRLVLEAYAPAAVLINRANDCLFSLGPIDRYLRSASGQPTHDLLAMARLGLRAKLRSAIDLARRDGMRVAIPCRIARDRRAASVSIEVQPVIGAGEELLLVCFIETQRQEAGTERSPASRRVPRLAALERELDATRTELLGAVHDLELSSEEHKAIDEEAASVSEEFQSTNEELLASKEELQSLNEELTALNAQLQETLELQRKTSDDLQNVLYSTNVATLFLDLELRIRFFTPATRSLFALLPGDVGRPLADFASIVLDDQLESDTATVLRSLSPSEREIEAKDGVWFRRRVMPYRTQGDRIEGVVITYTDVTARKHAASALQDAKGQAERANAAKSRFLAAASHDLRQPLQTLTLVSELLSSTVEGAKAKGLVERLGDTLGAMATMLNTLLDINQVEAGIVRAEIVSFAIGDLLLRMRDEFAYHAQAKGLSLRVVTCCLIVRSDPRLLEQMIRNLLSNALKYTTRGKVLLGCRRQRGTLRLEVWDTGIGIPEAELEAIFEEYHQVGNAARERRGGLGLGLFIVQRLGSLLGHGVRVRSRQGTGSVFAVEVPLQMADPTARRRTSATATATLTALPRHTGTIMVVEDDPDLLELLELLLRDEGHDVATASDGTAAVAMVASGMVTPDLILSDYNLPGALNGLEIGASLRRQIKPELPIIILTGDVSAAIPSVTSRDHFIQLSKPVRRAELTQAIERLLASAQPRLISPSASPLPNAPTGAAVFVVDDDRLVREAIRNVLEDAGRTVQDYATGEDFLSAFRPSAGSCLLVDAYLPGMSGLDLLDRLHEAGHHLPAIMITGRSDVPMAVRAMKAGASDFIEKPIGRDELLAGVDRALAQSHDEGKLTAWRESAASHVSSLTRRQRQVLALVVAGHPSKNIAADLAISQRTVENHRASIMRKTGATSLPALARLALAAAWDDSDEAPGRAAP